LTIKLYDLAIQPDGSVKVITELKPEEMQFMLEIALNILVAHGVVPNSLVHHFEGDEENQEQEEDAPQFAVAGNKTIN